MKITVPLQTAEECNFRRNKYGKTNANRRAGEVEYVTGSKR
jgi:hypothetical protein